MKVSDVCEVYAQALERHEQGERTISTDELTGVQALERKEPGLPMQPGKVERREFEYIRHGTSAFILSRDVVTGKGCGAVCRSYPYRSRLSGACAVRRCHGSDSDALASRGRQSEHPPIRVLGALGGR